MHPGLVPGINVEDQRNKFGLDKPLFFITAILIVAFIIWGVLMPDSVASASSSAFGRAITNAGWLLNITMMLAIVTMAYIGCSRLGRIKLGTDDEEPEFSYFSWVAMMFGAGIGVGIFFYGPSEPLSHYLTPPPHTVDGNTVEALHQAMAQAHYHWGISPWAAYALVGAAIAYSSYRRGRVPLVSSIFKPLFGSRDTDGPVGKLIDVLALIATLFGTAATLGLSAIQIGEGVSIIRGAGPMTNTALIVIIAVLGCAFIISAVSGVARGVRYLSNINISLTLGLVLFVFLVGPTLLLLNLIPAGIVTYIDQLLPMMAKGLSWGDETIEFQSYWTAFYWAWWIAWTPFVGLFVARISRGRTIREFTAVTVFAPTIILIFAFTIFGGTAISFNREGSAGFDGESSNEQVLFAMFQDLPLGTITPYILLVVLAVFFVTSADSASVVMGTMSSKGDPTPNKLVVVFWGLCMMGIAAVMLLTGGEDVLTGLQNLTILAALPFCLVLLAMMVAFIRDLRSDPMFIRRTYARTAMDNAIMRGIEEHGDDFEFTVQHAEGDRGAGHDFDSSAERYTEWYQRTDEEGENVDYDFGTGVWSDGYDPKHDKNHPDFEGEKKEK
ncbi:BCCT family transporter [Corynebacterium marquesiae]|uniref:BCCT family transporter n=1 Tax=Corynebacterium marquesiae TaxID=2913503 RepID=UPI0025516708|nr:BCCT family transporter [Corynebacterium marquesiae]MDK8454548.1 BCCT family transporter [Corynebacterium marquesiae]MDK8724665.1 BCCT family transporter [Corynebacterium marquesiae]MDK8769990.1 BCCT family transporter [Corynebacterium marquesiae]